MVRRLFENSSTQRGRKLYIHHRESRGERLSFEGEHSCLIFGPILVTTAALYDRHESDEEGASMAEPPLINSGIEVVLAVAVLLNGTKISRFSC